MARAAKAKADESGVLKVSAAPGKSKERTLADLSLDPAATGMATASLFSSGTFGKQDMSEVFHSMLDKVREVKDGSLAGPEATLTSQAVVLNLMFTELARRSALNMGEYIEASERYMRLALKAQAQCRATIETLAALKNPPIVYARQANIAAGHQQINNHRLGAESSPAGKTSTQQNELLEAHDGERLELGATRATEHGNPPLEAVEAVNGPHERDRKASLEP